MTVTNFNAHTHRQTIRTDDWRNRMTIQGKSEAPSDAVFEEAADWAAKSNSGSFDEQQRAGLDVWLAEDPSHAVAFERMQSILGRTEALELTPPQRALVDGVEAGPRFGTGLWWAAAASVAIIALTASLILPLYSFSVVAEPGQPRTVELRDGSTITLRGNSSLHVDYGLTRRIVRLRHGEAAFDVAHHAFKSFIVESQDVQVTAVGTFFSVAVFEGESTVTLIEGRVDVSIETGDATAAAQSALPDADVIKLEAGQQVAVHADGSRSGIQTADIARVTAWQQGRIVLERRPLTDLVNELNRSFGTSIRIDDADLASMAINVSLNIDERSVTLHRLEQQLPIEFRHLGQNRFVVVSTEHPDRR